MVLTTLAHHIDLELLREAHRRTRKDGAVRKGRWVIQRKTARGRFNRAVKRVAEWCKRHRHDRVRDQYRLLCLMVRGHYAYYGITSNARALGRFRYAVRYVWLKWLRHRSQRSMTPARRRAIDKRFPLPPPRIVHRYA